ncbi:MAG: NYN domain-containing protein [Aquificae bacterium]|nr:NYN domain-containing protein [Aquificota bacterium]
MQSNGQNPIQRGRAIPSQSEALPQNIKKIAILIDWENFRKTLERAVKEGEIPRDIFTYNDTRKLLNLIKSFVEPDEEIYRIYFYLSEPPKEANWKNFRYSIDQNENFRKVYENARNFIENLKKENLVSIRKGKLEFRGYYDQEQTKPIFTQKQVDMLIGLDIAHLSYLKLVDRIMLLSLDTDLIPAIKIARINGIQVVMPSYPDVRNLSIDIQEHTDFIRKFNLKTLIKSLGGQ